MRWRPQPKSQAISHSRRDDTRNTSYTHIYKSEEISYVGDGSVWNQRGAKVAPAPQFCPSAPVSLVEIDELVRKKKTDLWSCVCDGLLRLGMYLWVTQRYMRVNTCHHRHSERANTHKDVNLCGYLDFRGLIWFFTISFWGWCHHWCHHWSAVIHS